MAVAVAVNVHQDQAQGLVLQRVKTPKAASTSHTEKQLFGVTSNTTAETDLA